ncbi:MAG TPA: hypothetical protein VN840_07285 [Streptosporangiaceae bacterium]|nr:hypothetical protein [Streptosporangiaceae bacterium]
MPDRPSLAAARDELAPLARLEPDAIGLAQDTVIGMASAAPAVSTGLTMAAPAAATAYASGGASSPLRQRSPRRVAAVTRYLAPDKALVASAGHL